MSNNSKRYTDEFKLGAVRQVTEQGHSKWEVGKRLGLSPTTMYRWVREYGKPTAQRTQERSVADELRRVREELKRVTEERDILKKAAAYFAKESK